MLWPSQILQLYNLSSQQIFRFAINIFEQYTKMFFIIHLISNIGGWETIHTSKSTWESLPILYVKL